MPLKWTNRSRPPSSGVMKPKPLSSLNHLTVPVAINFPSATAFGRFGWLASTRPTREPYQGSESSVPQEPSRQLDRVLPGFELVREARRFEFGEDSSHLRSRPDPQLARELVAPNG